MYIFTEATILNDKQEPSLTLRVKEYASDGSATKIEIFDPNKPLEVMALDTSTVEGLSDVLAKVLLLC